MKATIHITLKNGVLDPQGKAIENALGQLGFGGIDEVRQGKLIEINPRVVADPSLLQVHPFDGYMPLVLSSSIVLFFLSVLAIHTEY